MSPVSILAFIAAFSMSFGLFLTVFHTGWHTPIWSWLTDIMARLDFDDLSSTILLHQKLSIRSDKDKGPIERNGDQTRAKRESLVKKKEKDVKKMEIDYSDKVTQMAARKAYIAKLETQIKELQKSNHLMKIQLSASQSTQDENPAARRSSSTNVNTGGEEGQMCYQCNCSNSSNQTSLLEQIHMHNGLHFFQLVTCPYLT
jgi:Tfp pilus assembly protein PilW